MKVVIRKHTWDRWPQRGGNTKHLNSIKASRHLQAALAAGVTNNPEDYPMEAGGIICREGVIVYIDDGLWGVFTPELSGKWAMVTALGIKELTERGYI